MTTFLLSLLDKYPWLIYVVLVIFSVLLILFIIGVIQGREVSIYPPKIGSKVKKSDQSKNPTYKPSVTQSQQQTQNVNIYQSMTQEQIDEVASRIAEKVIVIRKEVNNQPPKFLYQPSELSDSLKYIYSARHEIERKVRNLVLTYGGEWAGHSMASFDTYLRYAKNGNVISKELHQEISDFYIMYTQPMINFEGVSDEQLLEVQYLATHINKQLDAIHVEPISL